MNNDIKMYVEQATIYGRFRPQLVLKGWVYSNNYKVVVLKGKKQLDTFTGNINNREVANYFSDSKEDNHYGFDYETKISFWSKKITIQIYEEDKLIYEKIINNSFIYKNLRIIKRMLKILYKGIRFMWKEYHFLIPPKMIKMYSKELKSKIKSISSDLNFLNPMNKSDYREWIMKNEMVENNYQIEKFDYNPLLSILIPVYNVGANYLEECIESVLNQTYQNFEICIADDCSTSNETLECLKKYENHPKIKIKYRSKNGHISEATNTALEIASGEFVGLLDNDDLLTKNALYENVKLLNENKEVDMIYSDEDKLDIDGGRCEPHFKSDFAPDTLLSSNYICHFTVLRTSLIKEIGGFRKGFEGAQDYDLFLRFTEKTNKIVHIPKILYHWRKIPGSTSMDTNNKNYAYLRGKLALEEALKRRKINGEVITFDDVPYYMINYQYEVEPSVSIIIPTRDYADILEVCLKSLFQKTNYKNYEVIVVDNGSKEQKTKDLLEKYKKEYSNFKVMEANCEFNYSYLNNEAVKLAKGEYIVLLNNDTEIIDSNWIGKMVSYAMQEHIGAVGIKLLYPDNTVQHGGVIIGLGGVGRHLFLNSPRYEVGLYARLRVPYNYGCVTAACLMVNKNKFTQVGGLEEKLKVAFNDVDFNIKLIKAGFYNVYLPQVEMYHHESKSRGLDTTVEKQKRLEYEIDFMKKKWHDIINNDPFYNINFSLVKEYQLEKCYNIVRKGEINNGKK